MLYNNATQVYSETIFKAKLSNRICTVTNEEEADAILLLSTKSVVVNKVGKD